MRYTTPTHCPPNEMLADYASGAASPAISLLVAAHLTHCPQSRRKVAQMEAVGGALLSDEAPVPMAASSLDSTLSKIDLDGSSIGTKEVPETGPLPRPLAEAVGIDFGDIPWRFRLPGVSEYELQGFNGEKVSLLRAKPGSGIPQHTHEGRELTLILAGAMEDGGEVYRPGDVAVNTEEDDHKPRIVGDEVCYCLVVMDGGLRFTGTFSRALNLLAE